MQARLDEIQSFQMEQKDEIDALTNKVKSNYTDNLNYQSQLMQQLKKLKKESENLSED